MDHVATFLIGAVAGATVGLIYGASIKEHVSAEVAALKAHLYMETAAIKARVAVEVAALRAKAQPGAPVSAPPTTKI